MAVPRRLPCLTFAGLLLVSVLFTVLSLAWESWTYKQQDRQIDPATGRWEPTYDWQAQNSLMDTVTKVRVTLLWALAAHALFSAGWAFGVTRGWRGALLGLVLLAIAAFLALTLIVGSAGGPAMIG